MSLQWSLAAGFLYLEILVVLCLISPIFSPSRWNRLWNSNFVVTLRNQALWYFYLFIVILVLFMMDSVREMRKYSSFEPGDHHHSHLDSEMQSNMRLFRAQRNFYISGFALFLSVVIRRLIALLTQQASLIAQSEASMKQAASASQAAQLLMNSADGQSGNTPNETHDTEVQNLKNEIKKLEEEISNCKKDRDAIKSQAESTSKEYDRLLKEYEQAVDGAAGDKKHD